MTLKYKYNKSIMVNQIRKLSDELTILSDEYKSKLMMYNKYITSKARYI